MENPLLFLLYTPLLFILYLYTKQLFNKLRNLPPSPFFSVPFLGHLHLAKDPLYRAFAKVSSHHGPVVLLHLGSRPVLIVSSPDAAEECFTKNDIVFANRPHIMVGKYLGYNSTSLGWGSYGDHWRNLRKISSIELLSTHRLELLQHIRVDEVRAMATAINQAAGEGHLVDMKTALFEVTVNVVMRMIAGKRYYGENVEDVEIARKFREITKETAQRSVPTIGDFLPAVKWLGFRGVEKALMELQKRRDAFMQELVEDSKKSFASYNSGRGEAAEGKTMIEMLVALQKKEPEYYTDGVIRSLMLV